MLKLKNVITATLALLLLVNTCSALVDISVAPVGGTNRVAPGGTISYELTATVGPTALSSDLPQTEIFYMDNSLTYPYWVYTFSSDQLTLNNPGESKSTILTIDVPANATAGTYPHMVIVEGGKYAVFPWDPTNVQFIVLETDVAPFNVDLTIPEFSTVAVPMVAILGLLTIFGRRNGKL